MGEFFSDVYTWINTVAFFLVVIDKFFDGSLEVLFFVAALFGPLGAFIACLVCRHHTSSGLILLPLVVGLIHFGIGEVFSGIVGFFTR